MKVNIQTLPIEKIRLAPWNPKSFSRDLLEKLKKSIESEGTAGVLLVRKIAEDLYEAVDGNHRLVALKELGYKEVPCEIVDINDDQAIYYFLQRNIEWFEIDYEKLAELITNTETDTDLLIQSTPLEQEDIELLLSPPKISQQTSIESEPKYTYVSISLPFEIVQTIQENTEKTVIEFIEDFIKERWGK